MFSFHFVHLHKYTKFSFVRNETANDEWRDGANELTDRHESILRTLQHSLALSSRRTWIRKFANFIV